ncbi:unnamed protein product [Adineta ricciae]|uniref:Uncharacterized protein n=1 Tax=Adineta ricciae TaxID=249248 RepID=A0A815FCR0_ADIRI|nr:unnamed protein product [Adineta ricciae]
MGDDNIANMLLLYNGQIRETINTLCKHYHDKVQTMVLMKQLEMNLLTMSDNHSSIITGIQALTKDLLRINKSIGESFELIQELYAEYDIKMKDSE